MRHLFHRHVTEKLLKRKRSNPEASQNGSSCHSLAEGTKEGGAETWLRANTGTVHSVLRGRHSLRQRKGKKYPGFFFPFSL
jgi:hypothetical protein